MEGNDVANNLVISELRLPKQNLVLNRETSVLDDLATTNDVRHQVHATKHHDERPKHQRCGTRRTSLEAPMVE